MIQTQKSKLAVCIGINDYRGTANDLRGCINDANDWADLLKSEYSFETSLLLDNQATCEAVTGALENLVNSSKPGDSLVFTYSGHGTWVPDQQEEDEPDNRDEALAVFDGIIIDDELRTILSRLDPEVTLAIICDSCHSGTGTRASLKNIVNRSSSEENPNPPVPRFLPPEDEIEALKGLLLPVRRRAFYPESSMNHVLLTGCNAMEYSYDATFGARSNGAMTYFATQLIRSRPDHTWKELHRALRELLPSTQYPQSPQLEGPDVIKAQSVFI